LPPRVDLLQGTATLEQDVQALIRSNEALLERLRHQRAELYRSIALVES
jgi:hypothetical protein